MSFLNGKGVAVSLTVLVSLQQSNSLKTQIQCENRNGEETKKLNTKRLFLYKNIFCCYSRGKGSCFGIPTVY